MRASFRLGGTIVRHDRGLAASPPVRYRLIVEGKSIPSFFVRCHMDVALNGYLVQATAEAQHRTGLTVKLELSDEEAAFRDELRRIYTTEIPADIRERARAGDRTYPRRLGHHPTDPQRARPGGAQLAGRVGRQGLDAAAAPDLARRDAAGVRAGTAGVQRQHGRPGDRRSSARRNSRSGSCRRPPTSTSGGARASPSPRPAPTWRRCAPPRSATATATWSTARRPGPRSASTPTGSSASPAPTRTRPKRQAGISFLLAEMSTRRASRCGRSS